MLWIFVRASRLSKSPNKQTDPIMYVAMPPQLAFSKRKTDSAAMLQQERIIQRSLDAATLSLPRQTLLSTTSSAPSSASQQSKQGNSPSCCRVCRILMVILVLSVFSSLRSALSIGVMKSSVSARLTQRGEWPIASFETEEGNKLTAWQIWDRLTITFILDSERHLTSGGCQFAFSPFHLDSIA